MISPMNHPVFTLIVVLPCLLLLLLAGPSLAQNCVSESFSSKKLYSLCSSLPELNATLHWTYHRSNGTLDVAYRVPFTASGNSSGPGMPGANAFLAFQNSSTGAISVITTVRNMSSGYSPTIKDESLSFAVYDRSAEFTAGAYTIYATVALPRNGTVRTPCGRPAPCSPPTGCPTATQPAAGTSCLPLALINFLSGQAIGRSNL